MKEIKKIFFLTERVSWPIKRKTENWKQYHSYSVYDSFAAYQNQKQADIVWFDQKIPYDLAFLDSYGFPRA